MKVGDQVKLVGAAAESFPEHKVGVILQDDSAPPSYVSVQFVGKEQPLFLNRRMVEAVA
ncbi:hypothetical protein BcepSauron_123 [Burkholderia phage BcepSauron]|uniref:Uncharacterized protein n=2 Tax=Sarumanvirus TaxID=2843450 RepID=A0A482MMW9_9CAUD|nr:hypothetical protein H1O16_gp124 [Burkholderia phage BcepSaruman]YP_009904501.1 hypothetical protein H1O17_gp123 [Burkholderia phage BcepSauron]QBQ74503.1 hypothetical protein BcepSauron_123 [Burkholderia phage BcepSauron]QBX06537.1 hypothetical protein BcepSaruman_124 [Burkholderia phage BcepSaruman]